MSEPIPPAPLTELPETLGDNDCPICFEPDAIRDRVAVCPNGHKLCAECQPRVQSVMARGAGRHAACPLCRARIPFIPLQAPIRVGGEVEIPEGNPRYIVDYIDEHGITHMRINPHYIDDHPQLLEQRRLQREQARAAQNAADGRRGDPERPQRAIDAFNNIPARRAAQQQFIQNRRNNTIPQNARFGGFHRRNCTCGRRGGAQGVRFLRMPDGTRKYRCEVCYEQAGGGIAPEPPAWNLPAVAMYNDCAV